MRKTEREMEARVSAALGIDDWFRKRRGQAPAKRRKTAQRWRCDTSEDTKAPNGTQPVVSNIEVSSAPSGFIVRCRINGEKITYRDGLSRKGCDAVLSDLRGKMKVARE